MTPDELDRLEALAGAAAPWPWEVDDVWNPEININVVDFHGVLIGSDADAAFVASARQAVPRLVAEVRRLTRERDEAHAEGRSEAFDECETEALERETASNDDEAMFALGRMAVWAAEKARTG